MTDRIPLDAMTSDALDALYDRLERARDAVALHRQGLITTAELYAVIEAGPTAVEAAEPAWTPPPPGDTREQLPDHILNLIRPYLRGYTSTACQTAGYLAEAIADQAEHRAELAVWRARMKARCRDNQKYTGEICPNHTAPGWS